MGVKLPLFKLFFYCLFILILILLIMSIISQTFTINGQEINVSYDDDNHVEEYFDLSKFSSSWHDYRNAEYHFSQLLYCLRDYHLKFTNDLKETNLKTLGTFHMGSLLHREIQENIEKKSGFSVIERPLLDEFDIKYEFNDTEFEETIKIVGKVDLLDIQINELGDIKTTRYLPILEKLDQKKFEDKYGKYVVQALAYAFYLNHTYFKVQPIEKIKLILVLKATLETKIIWIEYNEETAFFFYDRIRKRAELLHLSLIKDELPDAEINKYCENCSNLEFCKEGKEYVISLHAPVDFETVSFNKEFPKKKAYIKKDGEWKKTKAFIEYCKKLKK